MPINPKQSAPLFATTDRTIKDRIDKLTKLNRRFTMSYIVDECVRAHLPKIEQQVKLDSGRPL